MRWRLLLPAAFAASAGACVLAGPAAPRVDEMSPDVVWSEEGGAVEIRGSGFVPAASADFDGGAGGYDDRFQAFLVRDGALWDLQDVARASASVLHASVPAGVPAAVYSLRVVDPRGREAWLTSALTITSIRCFTSEAAAGADATIDSTDRDRNDGAGDHLQVGDDGGERRALVGFDLASLGIPSGAQIVSASLRLKVEDPPSRPVTAFPVTSGWREHEVTWDRASSGTPWQSPGADLGPALAGGSPVPGSFMTWDVGAAVAGWMTGAPAEGFALVSPSPAFARFTSREGGIPPLLKVDWCQP